MVVQIVSAGTPEEVMNDANSLTGQYLIREEVYSTPAETT